MSALMTRLVVPGMLVMLVGGSASADIPNPAFSTIGTFIRLSPTCSGAPIAAAEKSIIVRDAGNSLVQGSLVEIRFGVCTGTGEFRICGSQNFPGMGLDCPNNTVYALTNASGVATFRVVGHALNPGGGSGGVPAPGLGDTPCAEVRADGQLLGSLRVKAYDENGTGGVNPVDLSLFFNDSFNMTSCSAYPRPACAAYRSRSDYNDTGNVNPVDLSLFLSVGFSCSSSSCSAASVCPP